MDREELLKKVSDTSGISMNDVKRVYDSMTVCIIDALSAGDNVMLMPELGAFQPKLNDNTARNENSPRTPRKAVYKVRFRPGKIMEKRLMIDPLHLEQENGNRSL